MMNIQPGTQTRRKKSRSSSRSSAAAPGALSNFIAMLLKAAFIFGIVGSGFYFYNSMNAQISLTAKEYAQVKADILRCENDIAQLRSSAESLQNHDYIKRRIAYHRLPLVEVHPRNQARLQILTPLQASRVAYRMPTAARLSVNRRVRSRSYSYSRD